MHNHNKDKQSPWMMWVMMICCALPLLILGFGLGGKALGASTWVIFGGVAVMIVAHFYMMGRSHKRSDAEQEIADGEDKNKNSKDNKNHSGHGCCH